MLHGIDMLSDGCLVRLGPHCTLQELALLAKIIIVIIPLGFNAVFILLPMLDLRGLVQAALLKLRNVVAIFRESDMVPNSLGLEQEAFDEEEDEQQQVDPNVPQEGLALA
jgi:hypothetical protein